MKEIKDKFSSIPDAQKRYRLRHQEKRGKYNAAYRRVLREKVEMLVGNSCILCGSKERLEFHEIHGKKHNLINCKRRSEYYLEHYRDIVPLCFQHHRAIHFLANIRPSGRKKLLWLIRTLQEVG